MEGKELLEKLFDEKKLKIMQFFFSNPEEEFYLREIAKKAKIPLSTTFRIVNKLKLLEIISENKIKKFKLYKLNQNKNTEFLHEIIAQTKSALNDLVDKLSTIKEISQIILHGKEEKTKANILIIGQNTPTNEVQRVVLEIKATYDFTILSLTLEPEQFLKMSEMGLFPGKRTILFPK